MLSAPQHLREVSVSVRRRRHRGTRYAPGVLGLNEIQCDAAERLTVQLPSHDAEGSEATLDGVGIQGAVRLYPRLVLVVPDVDGPARSWLTMSMRLVSTMAWPASG